MPKLPDRRSFVMSPAGQGLRIQLGEQLAGLMTTATAAALAGGLAHMAGLPPLPAALSALCARLVLPRASLLSVTSVLAPVLVSLCAPTPALGSAFFALALAVVGLLQVAQGQLKLAHFTALVPPQVTAGVRAGLGCMLVMQALPLLLGLPQQQFPTLVSGLSLIDPAAWLLGTGSLLGLLCLATLLPPLPVPPIALVVLYGVCARLVLGADGPLPTPAVAPTSGALPSHIQQLPQVLQHVPHLGYGFVVTVFTLWLLSTSETTAAAQRAKRRSVGHGPLRTAGLLNMGLGAFLGGLPTAAGQTTEHRGPAQQPLRYAVPALCVMVAPQLAGSLPLPVLGAVLVFVGGQLVVNSTPRFKKGRDAWLVYSLTVAATLLVDPLLGAACGLGCKLVLTARHMLPHAAPTRGGQNSRPAVTIQYLQNGQPVAPVPRFNSNQAGPEPSSISPGLLTPVSATLLQRFPANGNGVLASSRATPLLSTHRPKPPQQPGANAAAVVAPLQPHGDVDLPPTRKNASEGSRNGPGQN